MYCESLPGNTWQSGTKNTDIKLQTHQGKDMILLNENNVRGVISSVIGDRYVISDEKKNYYM